jgi:hypothetical protein
MLKSTGFRPWKARSSLQGISSKSVKWQAIGRQADKETSVCALA